ncbi:MAG TPA: hypothetical protein VHM66_08875, partial [Solirubrobacterales bacterium]|nr:hypothetical protein [Solirubrobacterales bacterium]
MEADESTGFADEHVGPEHIGGVMGRHVRIAMGPSRLSLAGRAFRRNTRRVEGGHQLLGVEHVFS